MAVVCAAICPEGKRRFNETLVPSRGGDFFHHAFQVNEFRTENLKPFSQFFDLMLDVFFYGGSFVKPVTDMNVH